MSNKTPGVGRASGFLYVSRKNFISAVAAQIIGTLIFLILLLLFLYRPLPDLHTFLEREGGTIILDRQGRVLQLVGDNLGEYRFPVPLEKIPEHTVKTFIKAEDNRFFLHGGADFIALYRAFMDSLHAGQVVSGGSGITMQVSRMITPRGEGFWGKILEICNAVRLEYFLTKEDVLSLYLNSVPFGFNTRGIEAASYRYWGREASTLTPAESVILAGIPRNPSSRNPIHNPRGALKNALTLVENIDYPMDPESLKRAVERAGREREEGRTLLAGRGPHFLRYLSTKKEKAGAKSSIDSRDLQFSWKRKPSMEDIHRNSRSVTMSSLDLKLQETLEETIDLSCEGGNLHRIKNGAGILLHNPSGEILAYLGSRDFSGPQGQIDGVRMRRQPGSTLKPFLYALAFELGYLPCTKVPDIPMDFGGEFVYRPENFDSRYRGSVLLREALASSLNIPAVFLLEQLGVKKFENFLIDAGFRSIDEQAGTLGVGLALGNGEVSLLELAVGFSVFPRGGVFIDGTPFLKDGSTSFKNERKLISPYTASLICHILSDPRSRETGFGRAEVLRAPFPFMVKTGTSDRYQNIWAVGSTPSFTAAVWFGSFTGETVVGVTGSSLPAAVVRMILEEAEKAYPEDFLSGEPRGGTSARRQEEKRGGPGGNYGFPIPKGVVRRAVCTETGELADEHCPSRYYELLPVEVSLPSCSFHGRSSNSFSKELRIISPLHNAFFHLDPRIPGEDQRVKIEVRGGASGEIVEILINGREIKTGRVPLTHYFPLEPGTWTLEARSTRESRTLHFFVRSKGGE